MIEPTIDYSSYILNEKNMQNYLKYKLSNNNNICKNNKFTQNGNTNANANTKNFGVCKQNIFIPNEHDSLFWCYYIISNGEASYETLHIKNSLIAKQIKIKLISTIRENKPTLKIYKFDTLANIESNLANDDFINVKTILALCAINNINVIYKKNKSYFELLMNDDKPIYIIHELDNKSKYSKKYGFEIGNDFSLQDIRNKLYKLENIDKPIKGLSSYKVKDLLDICEKLAIETIHKDTGKTKNKNELYESIIQFF